MYLFFVFLFADILRQCPMPLTVDTAVKNIPNFSSPKHRVGDGLANVFVSSAVDRGSEPRSGQTKDYNFYFYFIRGRLQLIEDSANY